MSKIIPIELPNVGHPDLAGSLGISEERVKELQESLWTYMETTPTVGLMIKKIQSFCETQEEVFWCFGTYLTWMTLEKRIALTKDQQKKDHN